MNIHVYLTVAHGCFTVYRMRDNYHIVPTSCVRHCTRWDIDSAALIEDVRGALGTDYADFLYSFLIKIREIRA